MDKEYDQLVQKLILSAIRVTPIRGQIIKIFLSKKMPISAIDLISQFKKINFKINKTTIYREIYFLVQKKILQEVEFGEGKKRYEIDTGHHHHHIICINCKKVLDVDLNVDLHEEEKQIESKTGFKITNHYLEFFGVCSDCR